MIEEKEEASVCSGESTYVLGFECEDGIKQMGLKRSRAATALDAAKICFFWGLDKGFYFRIEMNYTSHF